MGEGRNPADSAGCFEKQCDEDRDGSKNCSDEKDVCVAEVMVLTVDVRETRKSLSAKMPFEGLFMIENKCLILISSIKFSKPSLRSLACHAI